MFGFRRYELIIIAVCALALAFFAGAWVERQRPVEIQILRTPKVKNAD